MTRYDDPATFRGQLQRGRGGARRRASAEPGAGAAVYECVINDPRWDRQVEQRDSYLAGLIRQLNLPLMPIEQHLNAFDGADAAGIDLALQVLALLPFASRQDAAAVLRGYAVGGKHWHAALEAIGYSGAVKLPGIWDGLADDVVASHDDSQLADVVCAFEPWTTFAQTQPRIQRLLEDRASARRPARPPAAGMADRQRIRDARTEDLLQDTAAGGPARRQALEELGRRGETLVLDLAEDLGLRNAAGWIPGMPQALHHLGPAAVPRARAWVWGCGDSTLAGFGIRVLAERGDDSDVPALLSALHRDVAGEDWCSAEIPARGLGRLKASQAARGLAAAWESTVHSLAREAFLEGLQGCAPRIAESFAEEGLYDCEPSVQRLACTAAPDGELVRTRLRELASDPLTPQARDAADTRLAMPVPCERAKSRRYARIGRQSISLPVVGRYRQRRRGSGRSSSER